MTIQLDYSTAPTALMFEHLKVHDAGVATPPGLLAGSGSEPTRFDMRLRQSSKQKGIAAHLDDVRNEGLAKPDLAAPAVLIKRRSDRPTPLAHVRVAVGLRRRFHLYPPTGCVHGAARPVGSSWHT